MSPEEGHNVYFTEEEDRHEYGAGFLVQKDIESAFSPIGQEYLFLKVSEIFLSRPAISA